MCHMQSVQKSKVLWQFFLHRVHSCGRRVITEADRTRAQTSGGAGMAGRRLGVGPTSWLAVWREALPQLR